MTHHSPEPYIPAQTSGASTLPTIIDQLPSNASYAPQTQFTRARQAAFLRRLADSGEVRVAARASNVSHQTAYRMRRACRTFRLGWDAALLVARERAEDLLATRALHGVEEQVFYHGEVVATRRRYDSRLLLAHLARLDRLAERDDVVELAGAFDDVVEAIETTEEGAEPELPVLGRVPAPKGTEAGTSCDGARPMEVPACAGTRKSDAGTREGPKDSSPGPCNMRSMSRSETVAETAGAGDPETLPCPDCGGRCDDPDASLTEADCQWLGNRLDRMYAARPADALLPHQLETGECDSCEVEWAQLLAFEAGEPRWWEVVPEGGDEGFADAAAHGMVEERQEEPNHAAHSHSHT